MLGEVYNGFISKYWNRHNLDISIEPVYKNSKKPVSIELISVSENFLIDLFFIDNLLKTNINEKFKKELIKEKNRLIFHFKNDFDSFDIFNINEKSYLPSIFKKELSKFYDNLDFVSFSEDFEIKKSHFFSSLSIKAENYNDQFFNIFYKEFSKGSLLDYLEENLKSDFSSIQNIYYVFKDNIYELDLETSFIQLAFISNFENSDFDLYIFTKETCLILDINRLYKFRKVFLEKPKTEKKFLVLPICSGNIKEFN